MPDRDLIDYDFARERQPRGHRRARADGTRAAAHQISSPMVVQPVAALHVHELVTEDRALDGRGHCQHRCGAAARSGRRTPTVAGSFEVVGHPDRGVDAAASATGRRPSSLTVPSRRFRARDDRSQRAAARPRATTVSRQCRPRRSAGGWWPGRCRLASTDRRRPAMPRPSPGRRCGWLQRESRPSRGCAKGIRSAMATIGLPEPQRCRGIRRPSAQAAASATRDERRELEGIHCEVPETAVMTPPCRAASATRAARAR